MAGLFAGIGGIELGLSAAGHRTALLCEVMEEASAVLRARFPGVRVAVDVRDLRPEDMADVEVLTAGFPCQDLSQAGRRRGIHAPRSGLVRHVFRLLEQMSCPPRWLLFENVPFLLQLSGGAGMHYLTGELERLGYSWAYRTVDARAFGLAQRRRRVLLLAGKGEGVDPRGVLFADEAGPRPLADLETNAYGFYWTEGRRGLGWAVDGVPPLKGGSGVGIPSPPAIWLPGRREAELVLPPLNDAERLQGFAPGWTQPAEQTSARASRGVRWKLIGNAVSVPVSRWLGQRLSLPGEYDSRYTGNRLEGAFTWPGAAWGGKEGRYQVCLSEWPQRLSYQHLRAFVSRGELRPLSARATAGFLALLLLIDDPVGNQLSCQISGPSSIDA